MAILVNYNKCTLCGLCADVCPPEAITITDKVKIDKDLCRECGLCVRQCPSEALTFEKADESKDNKNFSSNRQTQQPAAQTARYSAGNRAGKSTKRGGQGKQKGGGIGKKCLCLKCNKIYTYRRGIPCSDMRCPECGSPLVRYNEQ